MTYLLVIFFLVFLTIVLFHRHMQLPATTIKKIRQIQRQKLPELISGKTGYADNNGIKIYYEAISKTSEINGDVLLVNGLSQTLLTWPTHFYQPIVDAGFRVIRFDNRGLGKSDWIKDWKKNNKYTLEDMATDAVAVLDALDVKSAHVIGVSMGGMISQRLAISHRGRVDSLISIMSTGFFFDPKLTDVPKMFIAKILMLQFMYARNLKPEENKVKFHVGIKKMLLGKGNYKFEEEQPIIKALYEVRNRNGFNAKASDQHSYAIKKSGSRLEELNKIEVPTLVIHGTDDPLIYMEHAKKYAPKIQNVRALYLNGMGHDLPKEYMNKIHASIFSLINPKKEY